MGRSVNKVVLVGRIGRDPEIRTTGSGVKVAHVSLATNQRRGEDGTERTDWHRLTLWNQLAELAEHYVHRGDQVYVEGRLTYDSYERDGVSIPTVDVNVKELVFLSPRREEDSPADFEEPADE
jgi:single-strand DNA-binding protein